jgi:hypothetical protein
MLIQLHTQNAPNNLCHNGAECAAQTFHVSWPLWSVRLGIIPSRFSGYESNPEGVEAVLNNKTQSKTADCGIIKISDTPRYTSRNVITA